MRRGNVWLLSLSAGLTAAAGCRTTDTAAEADAISVSYEGALGMRPGVGIETILEDVRGTCIEWDNIETSGAAQTATYEFEMVDKQSELAAKLDVSNAAQIKAAVPETNATVSAKTKFALGYSHNINKFSVFIVANVKIRNETSFLVNPRFKQDVKDLLAAGTPEAFNRFRQRCGDEFMSGFSTGGEFFGVLEIVTDSEEEQLSVSREVATTVAAEGIGELSNESTFAASLKNLTKNRELRVWTYQRGGSGADQVGMVDTVDTMLARVKALPGYVAVNPTMIASEDGSTTAVRSAPANYEATFQDYYTLDAPMPAGYEEDLEKSKEMMHELAGIQSQLIDFRGDISYVLAHPNSFVGLNATRTRELRTFADGINDKMTEINKAGRRCQRKMSDCVIPQQLLSIQYPTLPNRRTSATDVLRDVLAIKTTIQQIDTEQLYDAPFNPPECFVEVRVKARNATNYKRVVRTNTEYGTPRCTNLSTGVQVPLAVIRAAASGLNVSEQDVEIEVLLMEDDYGPVEQVLARVAKPLRDLNNQSAIVDVMTGTYVTANAQFEMK